MKAVLLFLILGYFITSSGQNVYQKNPTSLIKDSALIQQILHPTFDINNYTRHSSSYPVSDTILKEDFQSKYLLYGVSIDKDSIQFKVDYNGWDLYDTLYTSLALVWDGKYYSNDSILLVKLYFSFKDIDLLDANGTLKKKIDISTLKRNDVNCISILIEGYKSVLEYCY